jgi:hypothetical protein
MDKKDIESLKKYVNPERKEMPDIDLDISSSSKKDVLDYLEVKNKNSNLEFNLDKSLINNINKKETINIKSGEYKGQAIRFLEVDSPNSLQSVQINVEDGDSEMELPKFTDLPNIKTDLLPKTSIKKPKK